LYAYALIRSKLTLNIQEGKALLEKLFCFEKEGNFPIYLHEYPTCKDGQFSSQLLPVLFYLLRDFPQGLGEALTKKTRALSERIVAHLEKEPLSTLSQNRLDAFLGRFKRDDWTPNSSAEWGEFCVCSQMSSLGIERALLNWDSKQHVYIGKSKERAQEKGEPALTLFDLFMGEAFGSFSARALSNHPVHLRAPLILPCMRVEKEGRPFSAIIEKDNRQSFTLYYGDKEKTHSFVIEAKKGSFAIDDLGKGVYEIVYTYDEEIPKELELTELSIFVDDEQSIYVGKEKATAFSSGDPLEIHSSHLKIGVTIDVDPGQGQWMGHILKGNRVFQKSKEKYTAYDWKIGWRTLRREEKAFAKLRIDVTTL
jgi:hypothetical protein